MSRLLPENYFGVTTLVLGAGAVALQSSRRSQQQPVRPDADSTAPPWRSALAALDELLQQQAARGLARRTRVVVSNAFVRYALAPWTTQQINADERLQLMHALFADRYGERGNKWQIAVEPQRFEQAALAAAIDAELCEEIKAVISRAKLRLSSIEPALVHNLNTYRRRLSRVKSGWFVDICDGRIASLAFVDGAWSNVVNERWVDRNEGLASNVLPLLRRDALRFPNLLGGTVFLQNSAGLAGSIEPAFPVVRLADSNSLVSPACT